MYFHVPISNSGSIAVKGRLPITLYGEDDYKGRKIQSTKYFGDTIFPSTIHAF